MKNEICIISDLIERALNFIKGLDMATETQELYVWSFSLVSKKYEEKGILMYDRALMDEIVTENGSARKAEKISQTTYYLRLRTVKILEELHDTGEINWHKRTETSATEIPEYFSEFIEGYLRSRDMRDSSKETIRPKLVQFCRFLSDRGVRRFEDLDRESVRDYLAYAYPGHTGSMDDVIYYARSLLRYVSDSGVGIDPKAFLLLTHPAAPDKTVKPVISKEDIARLLNSVDRSKAPGKRDYAILVLGVYTGLRSVDIADLRFGEIFWKEKELRLTQHKTGKPLTAPLEDRAVNALADYILHERPETDSEYVFLKSNAPFTRFARANGIRAVFYKYLKRAGIEHAFGDGKTFHGLRRTLATGMLSEGTPVTTVSQTLGHSNVESTKQYISVDMTGLKRCALSFDAIGGERK